MISPEAECRLDLIEDTRKLLKQFQCEGERVNVPSETLVVEEGIVTAWFLGKISCMSDMPYYVAHALDNYGHPIFITRWTWRLPRVQRLHHSKMKHLEAQMLHYMVRGLLR